MCKENGPSTPGPWTQKKTFQEFKKSLETRIVPNDLADLIFDFSLQILERGWLHKTNSIFENLLTTMNLGVGTNRMTFLSLITALSFPCVFAAAPNHAVLGHQGTMRDPVIA